MNPELMAQQMQQLKGFYQPGMAGAAPGGVGTVPTPMGTLQNYQSQMGQPAPGPMAPGAQPMGQPQPQIQPSIGQQYQQFMQNGGLAVSPALGKPQSDDEWAQKLYMDQKYQEARGQEMSQFLQERERRSNSG